jgi:peroxiredoxin
MTKLPVAGEIAPEFALPDSTGIERRLSQLTATHSIVLVAYRGDW